MQRSVEAPRDPFQRLKARKRVAALDVGDRFDGFLYALGNGPASAQVKSRTRMPARGPAALSDEGIGELLEVGNNQVRFLGPGAERLLAAINECGVKAIGLGADAVEDVVGDK